MASSKPPKKEGQGKGVPLKEALDARVTKLSTSLQEMMADGEMSGQESSANEHRSRHAELTPAGLLRPMGYAVENRIVY